jgi:hypothetical protein
MILIEKGHKYQNNMNESNKAAAVQIFLSNNPDIKTSNMLDLHGLHVKEAIDVFKQTFLRKKAGQYTGRTSKLTFLF